MFIILKLLFWYVVVLFCIVLPFYYKKILVIFSKSLIPKQHVSHPIGGWRYNISQILLSNKAFRKI